MDLSIMLVSTGIIPAPPAFGGAIESHAFVLSNALARKGARVHFVSDVVPGAKFHPNVRVHPVHSPIKIFPAPFPTWILTHSVGGALSAMTGYSVTLSHRPDVAHFHEETSAAMYLSLKPRVPTAFTLHNPPPWIGQIPSSAEAYVRRTLSLLTAQRVIKRVNKFIALSSIVAREFGAWLGIEQKTNVVPHPIDTDFFLPDMVGARRARETYNLGEGPYAVFVGRLDPRKGVSILLRAIERLHPNFTTIIAGSGIERSSLMILSRELGIDSMVRFVGSVPRDLLPGLYSGAEFAVVPSLSEMSPMVVMEALSCGTPVVATDLPVLKELVTNGQNGFLVPPDPAKLSEAMRFLDSDQDLKRRMKRNARSRVLGENSPDVIADKLLRIYQEMATA